MHTTKQGSNAYQRVKKRKDCGLVLERSTPLTGCRQQVSSNVLMFTVTTAALRRLRINGAAEIADIRRLQSGRSASSA